MKRASNRFVPAFDFQDPEYLRMRVVAMTELVKEPETVAAQYADLLSAMAEGERNRTEDEVQRLESEEGMSPAEARAELLVRYLATFLKNHRKGEQQNDLAGLKPMQLPVRPKQSGKKRR